MEVYSSVAVAPELRNEEELPLLRAVLQASDYGVLFSNSERRDVICNRRFGELFGVDTAWAVRSTPEAVRAMVLPRLKDPGSFLWQLDSVYSNPGLSREDEIELQAPECVLRRYTTPVMDEMGVVIGRLWTFLDITRTRSLEKQVEVQAVELRTRAAQLAAALKSTSGRLHKTEAVLAQAQHKLMEAEKLSAVGLLAASIAHDIGNILSPLGIEIMLADQDERDVRGIALSAMRDQVTRLSLLTRRLMSLASSNKTEYVSVDMAVLIERLVNLLTPQAELEGIHIRTRFPPELPLVLGDSSQIEQVVINLAINSLQAMNPQKQGNLHLQLIHKGDRVCLKVSDTGPGIPRHVRRHLFDAFYSTKPGGAGLGLYSCRRIVEAHGGAIRVRSGKDRGTTFLVWLPAAGQN